MTIGRVVVFGPSYGRYPEAIANGFRQNGLQAVSICYPDPPATPAELLSWSLLPAAGITGPRRASLDRTVRRVHETCRQADLLLVVKSDLLPLDQYADLLGHVDCLKVLWLMDSVHNVRDGLERARLGDALFYFEGTDRPSLATLPVPHHHIALATDPAWYRPVSGVAQLWDGSFFGAFHSNRLPFLESIMAELPPAARHKMRFVGPWRTRNHPFRARRRVRQYPLAAAHLVHARNWSHEQINTLNNQSRICLNVLHPQSADSLNMRAFETCGSGAFQLCQSNTALGRWFAVGREVESYDTPAEAAEKILFYVREDGAAQRIAAAGRERVLRDHTMRVRTGQILALVEGRAVIAPDGHPQPS